jgi:hypothetical protein
MASKPGPFTFSELQRVTSLGRGEIRECIGRGIISAPSEVGQGHHRAYSKWNLAEGVIAAALLRHVRAGTVERIMKDLKSVLDNARIDRDSYCEKPSSFVYEVIFPPRKDPDAKADPPFGDEMAGESASLWGSATQAEPFAPLIGGTPIEAFCSLPVNLKEVVHLVNHLIDSKL